MRDGVSPFRVLMVEYNQVSTHTSDDLVWNVGNLAAGADAWDTYTLAWKFGQHTNTASVTVDVEQDATHTFEVSDTDDANYFGMMPAVVTNSSLCTFDTNPNLDGNQFNLIFTPDFRLGNGNFKLSDSNPGQFYYNVFYQGTGDATADTGDDYTDFTFEIPYPFVTQGAVPVHVYSSVTIDQHTGEICLTPGDKVANYKVEQLIVSGTDGDGNLEYTIPNVPTAGFVYINMHLDFGLEKVTGWIRGGASGEDALDNPAISTPADGLSILEGTKFGSARSAPIISSTTPARISPGTACAMT